uniref:Palmitoyltransferase n=1 Tax=Terrapene triunguis TaxID=2587831 RepID=A0A674I3F6_9SAUR
MSHSGTRAAEQAQRGQRVSGYRERVRPWSARPCWAWREGWDGPDGFSTCSPAPEPVPLAGRAACHPPLSFGFRCSWLAVHVSLAFPLVAGILFIPAVANLLLASFTDPGILHRGAEGQAGLVIQALLVKERRFNLHWCQKCQYYCPPRTFHCPWCNVCVEEFDHHCNWLNNCIGCRNFRFFFLFVAFLCSYNVVVLASCITYLVLNSHQAYGAEKICAIMVTIPAALYLLPLLSLVGSQASFITLAKRPYELKVWGGGSPAWGSGRGSSSWWW